MHSLPLSPAACERYLILFRTYVSRPSAGKGRAVLEGIGLAPETIRACYGRHPLEEEEAVQDGLIKWAEGHHGYSRTWRVLLTAMEYAGVAQHHCQGLKEELYRKLIGKCVSSCMCLYCVLERQTTVYNRFLQQLHVVRIYCHCQTCASRPDTHIVHTLLSNV